MLVRSLVLAAAVAFATPAAAGQWDGTWTGTAGDWVIKLVVIGERGDLRIVCNGNSFGQFDFTIPVKEDGGISSWIGGDRLGRRLVSGSLPQLNFPNGGSCGGGDVTLSRSSL